MKFVFDYEETLSRRITIEANSFLSAAEILREKLDNAEIVLGGDDFVGAEIRMPLNDNFLPKLQENGESVKTTDNLDILVDFW